jgi:hypothetical protein
MHDVEYKIVAYAQVDDIDFDALSKFRWIFNPRIKPDGTRKSYVVRITRDPRRPILSMAHEIMKPDRSSRRVCHLDRDGLNLQRSNLVYWGTLLAMRNRQANRVSRKNSESAPYECESSRSIHGDAFVSEQR